VRGRGNRDPEQHRYTRGYHSTVFPGSRAHTCVSCPAMRSRS
jgi:hypothetical protein